MKLNITILSLILSLTPVFGDMPEFDLNLITSLEEHFLDSVKNMSSNNLIPDAVIKDLNDDQNESYLNFSLESQEWIHNKLSDVMLNEDIKSLYLKLGSPADNDFFHIYTEIFIEVMRGHEIDIYEKFRVSILYRLESQKPFQTLSPLGKNRILWIWSFEINDREMGILHVGVDVKTRDFICFERTIGIYYPEGSRLKLIHEKIVQVVDNYESIDRHIMNYNKQFKENDDVNIDTK